MKPATIKKSAKSERERQVLLGLVEYYIKTGRPVGSSTLKEAGFDNLSSATIRNYFANLEEEGYLIQQHTSGGRLPTSKAYRLYAQEYLDSGEINKTNKSRLEELRRIDTREITGYLQQAAEVLSDLTQTAVFLTAPRFDHDYIIDLKLVPIDPLRCLCVIVTDFGVIQTEVLHIEKKLNAFSAKRIESYFHWRLSGQNKPENLTPEEEALAQRFYNELLVRYLVGYAHFSSEEIHRTGFAKLLAYPDLQEITALSNSLALFENVHAMRLLLKECSKTNQMKSWIGEDLLPYVPTPTDCSVLAAPYFIGKQTVGAIGILGPTRLPYRDLFGILRHFCSSISEALTRNIYKFKISFRQPKESAELNFIGKEKQLLEQTHFILLEDKRI